MNKIILILIFLTLSLANDIITYTKVINDLLPKREFKKAEKLLSQKLKKHPNDHLLLWAQANIWGEEGKIDKAIIQLQKILKMPNIPITDRNEITKLLNKYQEIKKAKENQNLVELKDLILNNGLSFLMIFLSILVGELLAKDVKECENIKEEKHLKKFLNLKQKATFKEIKCKIISFGLLITYTFFIALIVILIELLIEPNYLQNITSNELKIHLYTILFLSFLLNSTYIIIKRYLEKKHIAKKIANRLIYHMYENERLFNKNIYYLKLADKEKQKQILEKIELEKDKKRIIEALKNT